MHDKRIRNKETHCIFPFSYVLFIPRYKNFFHAILFEFDIISGGSGQTSFKSKRYLARGGQIKEGVTVLELQSNYTWRPVDKTNFAVGIVVAEGDKEEMLSSLTIPSGIYRIDDIYHW